MPWFKRADGVIFCILERYEDTLTRIRAEGWQEIADPTAPTIASVPVAAQAEVVTPASSPERAAPSPAPDDVHTSDTTVKKAPAAKRAPVKPKSVRKRTPMRRAVARKAAS